MTNKKYKLLEEIEKEEIKIPKGKHKGKSFCPQCEDIGFNKGLQILKERLLTNNEEIEKAEIIGARKYRNIIKKVEYTTQDRKFLLEVNK